MNKKNELDSIKEISLKFQAYIDPPNFDPNYNQSIPKLDVLKFIEKSLNKFNEIDRPTIEEILIKKAEQSIEFYLNKKIPIDKNYLNAKRVVGFLKNTITNQPDKIELKNINAKQIVWIFRILHQKGYIKSDKIVTAKSLSLLFDIPEKTASQYLSQELKDPISIFKVDWSDL